MVEGVEREGAGFGSLKFKLTAVAGRDSPPPPPPPRCTAQGPEGGWDPLQL